jgi:tetratricopeptide (TPR) repeat protein
LTNAQTISNIKLQNELNIEQAIFNNSNNDEIVTKLLLKKATYFKQENQFEKAIQTLLRVNESDLSDSNKFELFYQLAILNYLTNKYSEVDLNINKIKFLITDTTFANKLVLLEILNLNNIQKWKEAKVLLTSQLKYKNDSNLVNGWYKTALKFRPKKEKTAQALQTFFPGIGQIYAGKTLHGIINAGLILTGLVWGGYNIYNGYYVTSVFTGFFISYVFYSGGITYSINQVERHNLKTIKFINNKLNSQIIELLQP